MGGVILSLHEDSVHQITIEFIENLNTVLHVDTLAYRD